MASKIFKTLDEQIDILKDKGLIIENVSFAKEVLLRENYFFLNGYRHLFVKSSNDKVFISGTKFEELYSLFLFDRTIRNILFKNILIIENNIKSIVSYQLSKKYGIKENQYLNPNNFNFSGEKKKQVNDLLFKMKRQIKNNADSHAATKHYVENYGYIPLWVAVKVLSFGIVSELFTILKKEDQYEIVDFYNISVDDFINYCSILSNYRNLCAHEDIVFCNRTQKYIDDTKFHRMLNIDLLNNEYIYGKNDLFALFIILKYMLKEDEFRTLTIEFSHAVDNLEYNLRTIAIDKVLDCMGFPNNWKNLMDFKKEEMF